MTDSTNGRVVGVDVGGTFTDLIQLDQRSGAVQLAKVPSTTDNQAFGVLNALEQAGATLAEVDLIVHGTTTTTNAVLERKLSRCGLITTAGFRDVLELGRRTRPQAYGMTGQFEPIIPRDLRLEVNERLDHTGEVLVPLDEQGVLNAVHQLLDAGCESVLVHFLHSYANPAHELRALELIGSLWPNDYISAGHQLLSESREYERGVTAAVNASVQPLLERYIRRLVDELAARGYGGDVLVVNGNGGMVSSRIVAREAAKTVMSGPASGVMAAAYTGRCASRRDLITYDMGGTSTDVALIRNAQPTVSSEIDVEYGMPIHVPMVDVRTVGAGGGSIACVNAGGLIEVGPHSAGAMPGPICYGRGGTQATISDANLLLGRLDPANLNAVDQSDLTRGVHDAFDAQLGQPLGMDATAAAAAVIRVANTKMAGAIRMVSLSLGADPRDFSLFAFGGAGPLHACALARELAVPSVLVPCRPGITNALGCVVADLRQDFVRTLNRPLDQLDARDVHDVIAGQVQRGEEMIRSQQVRLQTVRHIHSVDMQFVGQTHLLRVTLPTATPEISDLQELFEQAYLDRFHVELADIRANLVNVNTSVIGERAAIDLSTLIDPAGRKNQLRDALRGQRPVYFDGQWYDTPVYWRDHLPLDCELTGPAVIEQMDCTILVEPGDVAVGDPQGNLVITVKRGSHDS